MALEALLKVVYTEAILRACKVDPMTLRREKITGQDLAKHLQQLMQGWSEENMCNRVSAPIRFEDWLARETQGWTLDDEISTVTMQRYLDWVHSDAGSNMTSASEHGTELEQERKNGRPTSVASSTGDVDSKRNLVANRSSGGTSARAPLSRRRTPGRFPQGSWPAC